MASNSPDPGAPRPSGFQSVLAKLKGMVQSLKPGDEPATEDLMPTFDEEVPAADGAPPAAIPTAEPAAGPGPHAVPVETPPQAVPVAAPEPVAEPVLTAAEAPAPAPILCRVCQSPRIGQETSCADCGYYFSPQDLAATIYHTLGIPLHTWYRAQDGRPIELVPEGRPVRQLVG